MCPSWSRRSLLHQKLKVFDVSGPSDAQIRTAARSFHSVDRELESAEAEHSRLLQEAQLSFAKVDRLRRQRKSLSDRVYRMVERGVQSLEELERLEVEERIAAESAAPPALDPPLPPTADPEFAAFLQSGWRDLEPFPLGAPGAVGEIVGSPSDTSQASA